MKYVLQFCICGYQRAVKPEKLNSPSERHCPYENCLSTLMSREIDLADESLVSAMTKEQRPEEDSP